MFLSESQGFLLGNCPSEVYTLFLLVVLVVGKGGMDPFSSPNIIMVCMAVPFLWDISPGRSQTFWQLSCATHRAEGVLLDVYWWVAPYTRSRAVVLMGPFLGFHVSLGRGIVNPSDSQ